MSDKQRNINAKDEVKKYPTPSPPLFFLKKEGMDIVENPIFFKNKKVKQRKKNRYFPSGKRKNLIFKKKKIKLNYTKNRRDAEQKHLSMTKGDKNETNK